MKYSDILKREREKRGLTQAHFAALIGISKQAVSTYERGDREPLPPRKRSIEKILNLNAGALSGFFNEPQADYESETQLKSSPERNETNPRNSRPIVGYIGAGDILMQFDDHAQGAANEFIDPPFDTPDQSVAVKVHGTSMYPEMRDGDILIYNYDGAFDIHRCIGRRCVIKTNDDKMLVKRLELGSKPSVFNLVSVNRDIMKDIEIQWAAPIIGIIYR